MLEQIIRKYAAEPFAAGDDAAVLFAINAEVVRVKTYGRASIDGLSEKSVELAESFLATMEATIAALRNVNAPRARLLESYVDRLVNNEDGIDFANPVLREQVGTILNRANWSSENVAAVLSLGYVLRSPAAVTLGREATLADVAAYRLALKVENWKARFDAALNKLGTTEHAGAAADVDGIARELAAHAA